MPDHNSQSLPLIPAYSFLQRTGHGTEAEEIRTSQDKLGGYKSTLRRAKILALLQKANLFEQFVKEEWNRGGTPDGTREIRRLSRIFERFQKSAGRAGGGDGTGDHDPQEIEAEGVEGGPGIRP